jgi:hypothetical protein
MVKDNQLKVDNKVDRDKQKRHSQKDKYILVQLWEIIN